MNECLKRRLKLAIGYNKTKVWIWFGYPMFKDVIKRYSHLATWCLKVWLKGTAVWWNMKTMIFQKSILDATNVKAAVANIFSLTFLCFLEWIFVITVPAEVSVNRTPQFWILQPHWQSLVSWQPLSTTVAVTMVTPEITNTSNIKISCQPQQVPLQPSKITSIGIGHASTAVMNISQAIPHISQAIPRIRQAIPHICQAIPHICTAIPHICTAIPHICQAIPHICLATSHIC